MYFQVMLQVVPLNKPILDENSSCQTYPRAMRMLPSVTPKSQKLTVSLSLMLRLL